MITFCDVVSNHTLEQVNLMMKVAGGHIGITLKVFLVAPMPARSAEETKTMADLPTTKTKHHHELTEAKFGQATGKAYYGSHHKP